MIEYRVGNSNTNIEIKDAWLVLDIGSGHNPHPRADVLMDRYLEENADRSGKPIKMDKKRSFIIADAQYLPFKDKVIDYIIASHIAEHAEDPESFCRELIRIGKKGYVETPSKIGEIFLTERFHKWYVHVINHTLIFEKITNHSPLCEFFYRLFYFDIDRAGHETMTLSNRSMRCILKPLIVIIRRVWTIIRNITYTRFEWDDTFDFRVIRK